MTSTAEGDDTVGVFEAMGTARAMRWLRPDPVPWPVLERVLWAATRASSPNNVQPWDFLVVQDRSLRSRIGELLAALVPPPREDIAVLEADPATRRTARGAMNLMTHMADVPAIVFVCGRNVYPPAEPDIAFMHSAVYAAAQNLIVAARASGLGAAFTTFHRSIEGPLRDLLAVPGDCHLCVTVPLGWPDRPFGPLTRRPLEEVLHHDGW